MIEPSINHAEPDDAETLNMRTAFEHDWNDIEYVRIGVLEKDATGTDGTVSFQLVQFGNDYKCKSLQANLSKKEIDVVIEGLMEAKKRMDKYNDRL